MVVFTLVLLVLFVNHVYSFPVNDTSVEGSSSSELWYEEDYYSLEDSCPPTHFWHIRGHQCVPFKCPKGNSLRDWRTGMCLFESGDIKMFAGNRMAFKHRNVMKLQSVPGRFRQGTVSKWAGTRQKFRVGLDDDTPNPTGTVGLIG